MITHGAIEHLPLLMEMLEFSCIFFGVTSVLLVYVLDESSFFVVVCNFFWHFVNKTIHSGEGQLIVVLDP